MVNIARLSSFSDFSEAETEKISPKLPARPNGLTKAGRETKNESPQSPEREKVRGVLDIVPPNSDDNRSLPKDEKIVCSSDVFSILEPHTNERTIEKIRIIGRLLKDPEDPKKIKAIGVEHLLSDGMTEEKIVLINKTDFKKIRAFERPGKKPGEFFAKVKTDELKALIELDAVVIRELKLNRKDEADQKIN